MAYANVVERQALISGLRGIADFLERNPEIPAPRNSDLLVFPDYAASDAEQRREIDRIASLIGSGTETTFPRGHYVASRMFGPVEYRAVAIPASKPEEKG